VLPLQPQPAQAPQAIENEAQVGASTTSEQGTSVEQRGRASSSTPSKAEPLQVCVFRTFVCKVSYGAVLVLHIGGPVSFISLLFFAGCRLCVPVICYSPHAAETR